MSVSVILLTYSCVQMAAAAAAAAAPPAVESVYGVPVDTQSWIAGRLFRWTGVPGMGSHMKAELIARLAMDVADGKVEGAAKRANDKISEFWMTVDPVDYASEAVVAFNHLVSPARGLSARVAAVVFTPLHALMSRRLGHYASDDCATQEAVRCLASDFTVAKARAVCTRIARAYELPPIPLPPVFQDVQLFTNCPRFAVRLNFQIPTAFASVLVESPVGPEQCAMWADCDYAYVELPGSDAEAAAAAAPVAKAHAAYLALKQEAIAAAFHGFPHYAELTPLIMSWL